MQRITKATADGRTFTVGQRVVAKGDSDIEKTHGRIEGFRRSVDGESIIAKIRVGSTLIRATLADIEPDPYDDEARAEIARRGISGALDAHDIRALHRYRANGMTAVEAGAQRAMDIIRRNG